MGPNQTYELLHSKGNHRKIQKDNLWNGRKKLQMMKLTRAQSPKCTNNSYNSKAKKQPIQKMGRRPK